MRPAGESCVATPGPAGHGYYSISDDSTARIMPELPEVETVVRTLRPRLVGRLIRNVQLARPDILQPAGTDLANHLLGRTVRTVERRGKRIVIELDNGNRFYVHLGMTGRLTIELPDAPVKSHTHLVIEVTEPANSTSFQQVRFQDPRRFGGVWWLGRTATGSERMGPEPLAIRWPQLATRLAKTRRPIKSALLDQTLIAGLGNIYVDESLFRAGIHPLTLASALEPDQVCKLTRAIKQVLKTAIRHRGSTLRDYRDAEGNAGGFQQRHKVYAREGKPCTACKGMVERIVLGGRSTHFCAKCQAR
jgi:formamidopyrimidine-DNA glycosylase